MDNKNEQKTAGEFYNEMTGKFLEIYDGNTIQGHRPKDLEELHRYIIEQADLHKWNRMLDAGCGVCGPSVFFAENIGLDIEAITISDTQYQQAMKNAAECGVPEKINVSLGDFRSLTDHYEPNTFDRAIFLESLGHAGHVRKVAEGLAQVMQPGGMVYIKDLYRRISSDDAFQQRIDRFFELMNEHYSYTTLHLTETIDAFRENNFLIDFIKPIVYENDTSWRKEFESRNEIDLFEGQQNFDAGEWLEIRLRLSENH